jgi:camelysin-like metallo-endopeptidase
LSPPAAGVRIRPRQRLPGLATLGAKEQAVKVATRLESLVRHPKRTLTGLLMVLVAVGIAVGTGANFSAQANNPANTFTAGIVKMDNSKANAAILAATNMKPGAPPQTGTVDIQNTGSMDMSVTLTRDQLSNTDTGVSNPAPFADKVNLTITDCGVYAGDGTPAVCGDADDHSVYGPNATLSGMSTQVALGTFAKDEKHRYRFAAGLDGSAGNEYVNDGSSARFVWDGVQTP